MLRDIIGLKSLSCIVFFYVFLSTQKSRCTIINKNIMRKFQFLLIFLLGSSSIADDVTQFTHNGVKLFLEEHSYFLMHLHVTKYLFHARCKFIKKTSVIYIYFFFNRRYSLLSFRLPQRILIHINSEALPITYSVCCVFVELADKLYNP